MISDISLIQLGCLKNNPKGLAFWKDLGFYEIDHTCPPKREIIVLERKKQMTKEQFEKVYNKPNKNVNIIISNLIN